jgi:hypothetical protein
MYKFVWKCIRWNHCKEVHRIQREVPVAGPGSTPLPRASWYRQTLYLPNRETKDGERGKGCTQTDKKKTKFSSYVRKSRSEQLQSHIWLTASSYMTKYLRISSYIRKPFLIYDFATVPIWIPTDIRKILFSFLSVHQRWAWSQYNDDRSVVLSLLFLFYGWNIILKMKVKNRTNGKTENVKNGKRKKICNEPMCAG